MPSHDFSNIGDVLDFDILRGTITAVDSATDTCTVSVGGDSLEALLFYHCEPDSILRDNGAIEGAAAGFAVDDEVIVMVRKDREVVKVIAHVDGIERCGKPCAEFIMGPIVVVWDLVNDCPYEIDGVVFPCRSDLPAYADWRSSRKLEETASSLFSINTHCGNIPGRGLETVGCPTLCEEPDEWLAAGGFSLVGHSRFWDAYAGTQTTHGVTYSSKRPDGENEDKITYNDVFFTAFGINMLPGISINPGVRTFYQQDASNTLNMPYGEDVEPDADWGDDRSIVETWRYYGILKNEPMYEFTGSHALHGWSARDYGWPYHGVYNRLSAFAPHTALSVDSIKLFERPQPVGMYSDNAIVFLTLLQVCPVTETYGDSNGIDIEGGAYDEYSYSGREIIVQAVSHYYEEAGESYGRDYTNFTENQALGLLLKEAIDMLYTDVLELDINEIVKIVPEIKILK